MIMTMHTTMVMAKEATVAAKAILEQVRPMEKVTNMVVPVIQWTAWVVLRSTGQRLTHSMVDTTELPQAPTATIIRATHEGKYLTTVVNLSLVKDNKDMIKNNMVMVKDNMHMVKGNMHMVKGKMATIKRGRFMILCKVHTSKDNRTMVKDMLVIKANQQTTSKALNIVQTRHNIVLFLNRGLQALMLTNNMTAFLMMEPMWVSTQLVVVPSVSMTWAKGLMVLSNKATTHTDRVLSLWTMVHSRRCHMAKDTLDTSSTKRVQINTIMRLLQPHTTDSRITNLTIIQKRKSQVHGIPMGSISQ